MGPAFVVRGHYSRECPWNEIDQYVSGLLYCIELGKLLDLNSDEDETHRQEHFAPMIVK